jgi:UDP-glucose 4-epimerase
MKDRETRDFGAWLNMQGNMVDRTDGSTAIDGHTTGVRDLEAQFKARLGVNLGGAEATAIITILTATIMVLSSAVTVEAAERSGGMLACSLALTSPRRAARCA